MGASGPGAGRDGHALHRCPRQRPDRDGCRQTHHRHPQDRRPVHAQGSVLHDPALRPSGGRPGHLSPEGVGTGGAAEVVLARRSPADAQRGSDRRIRVLGQSPAAAGPVGQRTLDRRPAARRARSGGRQAPGAGVRLLRRGSRRRGSGVPDEQVQGRAAVRPQPVAREGDVARAVPGLRAERRTADAPPGLAAAAARARMVRRGQRQMALGNPRPGRAVPRQVPGPLVPHLEGRDDRRRDEMGRRPRSPTCS